MILNVLFQDAFGLALPSSRFYEKHIFFKLLKLSLI